MLDPTEVKYFKLAVDDIGKETLLDVSARCIVCGDSNKSKSKKRLHLYTKPSWQKSAIKCFNCDYSSSMFNFLKDYRPDLLDSFRKETGYNTLNSLKDEVITVKAVNPVKNNIVSTFDKPENIVPLSQSTKGMKYLINRKIKPNSDWYIGTGTIDTDKEVKPNLNEFLIIPLLDNSNKWFGFYSRSLNTKKFYTYIPESNSGYKVYNWFYIDKTKPVYIFESIMDMLSTNLENSIAILGADLNDDRLKELNEPVFIFDNDKTGKEKRDKYLQDKRVKAFIWPSEYKGHIITEKDCNELLQKTSKEFITDMILNNISYGFLGKIKSLIN